MTGAAPGDIPVLAASGSLVAFDMDDTLYGEIDYVRSGFAAVASYLADRLAGPSADSIRQRMWHHFHHGDRRKVFNTVLAELSAPAGVTVESLVECYRLHTPAIRLRPEAESVLNSLRVAGARLAVVTDGPLCQQQPKANALDLARHVDEIVFTDALGLGCSKPSPAAFEHLMQRFALSGGRCAYVADNPRKDFVAPRRLGWLALQYLPDEGIYCREQPPPGGQPHAIIHDLRDVLQYIRLA